MAAPDKEQILFEEKDRLYRLFSDIANSLRLAFFRDPGTSDATAASEVARGDVLQHVLDHTRETLHAEKCALFLADIPAKSLILERVSGEVDFAKLKDIPTYDLTTTGAGTGVTPWVYHRRQPFNARNFDELLHNSEGHWKGNWDGPLYGSVDEARTKFQCVYMAPLMAGDQAIGVIKYENRVDAKTYYNKNDERLIDMIAALVTNLVISQRIERNRYDQILPVISTALVPHFDRSSSYDSLLETCRTILRADVCSLFLLDSDDSLVLECITGVSQDKKHALRGFGYNDYRRAKGLTPWILRKRSPFNVRSYPDLKGRSEGHHVGNWDSVIYDGNPAVLFKSLYSVPLVIGDEPIGVFKVENKNVPPYYFTESDERLFDLIGRLIAVGVRYAKTREHEEYLLQMARNVELGFLAAGISHEFNGYLQRMLSTARVALDGCRQGKVKNQLEQIVADIAEATKIIDMFRSMRSQVGRAIDVDLDEIVGNVIGISKERFATNNIRVHYTNSDVKTFSIDPGEMHSILINLLNNAFDSVMAVSTKRLIEVAFRREPDGHIVLEVIDSGAGISIHERGVVFAPFFTTKPQGMGMGLYVVQRLVNDLGGRITVTSPNGLGGATFCVSLPSAGEGASETK